MKQYQNPSPFIFVFSLRYDTASENLACLATPATKEEKAAQAAEISARQKFYEIYSGHNERVLNLLFQQTSVEEAEDLSQEVWVAFHKKLQGDVPIEQLVPYLNGIVSKKILEYIKKKKQNKTRIDGLIDLLVSNFKINGERILKLENSDKSEVLAEILDAIEDGFNRIQRNELKIAWLLKHGFYDPTNVIRISILTDKDEEYVGAMVQTTKNGDGRSFIKEDNAALIMGVKKKVYLDFADEANRLILGYLKVQSWSKPSEELLHG